ncbi:MAG TPA: pentapeptide repeat-containing protein [Acetobacteraceae bacterium]
MKEVVRLAIVLASIVGLTGPRAAQAAEITVRQVITILREARRTSTTADLHGRDLSRLDLADLDFSGVNLSGASLFGADLTGARLVGAKLSGANLDRTILVRADFSGADLHDVTMFLPATAAVPGVPAAGDAPRFHDANLAGARLFGSLGDGDWSGANLAGAHLSIRGTQFLAAARTDLGSSSLSGANLAGADLVGVRLPFADLRGANLRGADLRGADLAGAHLSGADLTGARLDRANVQRADLRGVLGLDQASGVANLQNFDMAEH